MARTYTYTCSYCGESFSSPRELGRHEKRYEGQCEDFAQRSIAQRTELWQCATDNRQAAAAQPQAVVDSIRDQDIETASNFHCELDVEQLISDPQVPATVFDSTYQLFTFVKQWGLSASQQQELLNLLHNPDFRQSEVRLLVCGTLRQGLDGVPSRNGTAQSAIASQGLSAVIVVPSNTSAGGRCRCAQPLQHAGLQSQR
jgi:hypothetical protein